jgi:hypothetical protein
MRANFRVMHSYKMGAAVLAARVLAEGNRKLKGYDMTKDEWRDEFPAWL